jgi:hypothetical protein
LKNTCKKDIMTHNSDGFMNTVRIGRDITEVEERTTNLLKESLPIIEGTVNYYAGRAEVPEHMKDFMADAGIIRAVAWLYYYGTESAEDLPNRVLRKQLEREIAVPFQRPIYRIIGEESPLYEDAEYPEAREGRIERVRDLTDAIRSMKSDELEGISGLLPAEDPKEMLRLDAADFEVVDRLSYRVAALLSPFLIIGNSISQYENSLGVTLSYLGALPSDRYSGNFSGDFGEHVNHPGMYPHSFAPKTLKELAAIRVRPESAIVDALLRQGNVLKSVLGKDPEDTLAKIRKAKGADTVKYIANEMGVEPIEIARLAHSLDTALKRKLRRGRK